MPRVVNVYEAKTNLSALLDDVRNGEEIVLAKHGVPYAKLVPLALVGKRELGFLDCAVPDDFFEPLPAEELDVWEGATIDEAKPSRRARR